MTDLLNRIERPTAEFSLCRTYRYLLRRRWGAAPPDARPVTVDNPRI